MKLATGRVHLQNQMVVIAHDRVRGDIDGEDFAQQHQAIHQPGLAVVKVLAGIRVFATEEGPSDTPGNAMVVGCVRQRDDLGTGPGHGLPADP